MVGQGLREYSCQDATPPPLDRTLTALADHLAILVDKLEGQEEPRPFWSTLTRVEAEYEKRSPPMSVDRGGRSNALTTSTP